MCELLTKAEQERWEAARERLRLVLEKLADAIRQGGLEQDETSRTLELKWQAISDLRYGLFMHDDERTDAILAIDWERFALGDQASANDRTINGARTEICPAISDCLLRAMVKRHCA